MILGDPFKISGFCYHKLLVLALVEGRMCQTLKLRGNTEI